MGTTLRPLVQEARGLAAGLGTEASAQARRSLWTEVVGVSAGPLDARDTEALLGRAAGGLGLLILSGVALERTSYAERTTAEVVGPGDLLWAAGDAETLCGEDSRRSLQVVQALRVAVLDDTICRRARLVPEVYEQLLERCRVRELEGAKQRAIVDHPSVARRLELLFAQLADRWGRVTPDGVLVPFRLTHRQIGELVAAQRPTVTMGMGGLERKGAVRRHPDGWLVAAPEG